MEIEDNESLCVVCRRNWPSSETVAVSVMRAGGAALVEATITRQPVAIDVRHPDLALEEVSICRGCADAIARAVHDACQREEFET